MAALAAQPPSILSRAKRDAIHQAILDIVSELSIDAVPPIPFDDWTDLGLGLASSEGSRAMFRVVAFPGASRLRQRLNLPQVHFHITVSWHRACFVTRFRGRSDSIQPMSTMSTREFPLFRLRHSSLVLPFRQLCPCPDSAHRFGLMLPCSATALPLKQMSGQSGGAPIFGL